MPYADPAKQKEAMRAINKRARERRKLEVEALRQRIKELEEARKE